MVSMECVLEYWYLCFRREPAEQKSLCALVNCLGIKANPSFTNLESCLVCLLKPEFWCLKNDLFTRNLTINSVYRYRMSRSFVFHVVPSG